MRMLVVFEKGTPLRHIGHLDLMRTMQRALRRSGLPVAYSQGFNPHILANFASALSVGVAGKKEIMDVALTETITPDVFIKNLNSALPPALQVLAAYPVEDSHPAPMAQLAAASYTISLMDPVGETLVNAIPSFLEKHEIFAMRKTKSGEKLCDIRPMIYNLTARAEDGHWMLDATLALREEATLKTDLLISSLCLHANVPNPKFYVVRTGLWGKGKDGNLAALETL